MEHFGERIRELRRERGIPIYVMAERLGISRNTLINWERGEKEPHAMEILKNMAEILDVPMKRLLAGENEVDIESNPIIENLTARVSRLEKILGQSSK